MYAFGSVSSALLKAWSHDASACPAGVSGGATSRATEGNTSKRMRNQQTVVIDAQDVRLRDPSVRLSILSPPSLLENGPLPPSIVQVAAPNRTPDEPRCQASRQTGIPIQTFLSVAHPFGV